MDNKQIQIDPVVAQARKDYKDSKDRFKFDIREMVQNQKNYKAHRSGEYSQGEQSKNQSLHAINRKDLRHWYVAYAVFRQLYGGYTKNPEYPGFMDKINDNYLQEIIKKYVPKTVYTG
jgi:hypothetical protein